jgi:predicted RNase H-like HicB family nuclease
MSEFLRLTIVYEQDEDGLMISSVPEVPGAHSQGRTREEARDNVLDALRGLLELRASGYDLTGRRLDSESLELVVAYRHALQATRRLRSSASSSCRACVRTASSALG